MRICIYRVYAYHPPCCGILHYSYTWAVTFEARLWGTHELADDTAAAQHWSQTPSDYLGKSESTFVCRCNSHTVIVIPSPSVLSASPTSKVTSTCRASRVKHKDELCTHRRRRHTHTHIYTTSEWVIGVSVCHCVKQIHAGIASKWHRTLQLCSLYVYLLLRHVACVWMCVSVCVPACVFPLPFARCVTVWVRSHERSSAAVMRITASEYKKKKKNMLGGRQHEHSLKHIWPLLTMGSPR